VEPEPTARKKGQPRTPADAEALTRFDAQMAFPLVLAAVLPLLLLPGSTYKVLAALVNIAAWIVFVVDFVAHQRRLEHYLATWLGRFDLVVVILTAPWFLLPNAQEARFVMLIRLARLARVVMAGKGAHRLFARIGRVAIFAVAVVFVGAAVAYRAEHKTNAEFGSYGDALWWAVVTLTTVGYGDIVPETTAGRVTGVFVMVTGIGILGVLAGSLASFFRLSGADDKTTEETTTSDVAAEIALMRAQISVLTDQVSQLVRRD
jgi:voltage-gated potassium channel